MNTDQQVLFVLAILSAAVLVTLIVWFRAYRRNQYIERTGRDYDGSVYSPHD
jgi:hypothetical protein